MRIGCILTGYGMADYVESCLRAWIAARTARLDDHEFVICAVSVPFAAFPDSADDGTVDRLAAHLAAGEIDHLITEPKGIPETEARGLALTWLKTQHVDAIWQVDVDEQYTEQDISRIIRYVDANPFVAAFRLSLKNYVFDRATYLADPFTPMRIHRIKAGPLEASAFWADNNVSYQGAGGRTVRDDALATLTVPATVAWVRHITWLNDERSKRKIVYHEGHFASRPEGLRCSYSWDETKGLVFNDAYYRFVGHPLPRLLKD